MADRGFSVDAIDISPTAIELAISIANKRNLRINYLSDYLFFGSVIAGWGYTVIVP
ncbi:hypothetical protein [Paenibacillus sp. KN14-4R]|uniref:hypothetical protein n=1 Tax=Paenibacillus sp. KN14-4R TaxID=3445773 RepID=UPI003FA108F8